MTSVLASCKLVGILDHFPEHLFDRVYRELFPRDGADPSLRQILSRDLGTGVQCLRHVGLPLNTGDKHLLRACQRALGTVLQQWQPLAGMLGTEGLGHWPEALNTGQLQLGNQACGRLLDQRRDQLRGRRNELEGEHSLVHVNGLPNGELVYANPEPTFWDLLELEPVLRRLHMVCALEEFGRLCQPSGSYPPDWRILDKAVLKLYAAAYGRWVKPQEFNQVVLKDNFSRGFVAFALSYQVFYLNNRQQAGQARRDFAQAFLRAYEQGRLH